MAWGIFRTLCSSSYCVHCVLRCTLLYVCKVQQHTVLAWLGFFVGFITMTPQLFINYKLKSVAHLPWRMLTYKALNTFIDDMFAFVIKMPMMYRIGCFRDGETAMHRPRLQLGAHTRHTWVVHMYMQAPPCGFVPTLVSHLRQMCLVSGTAVRHLLVLSPLIPRYCVLHIPISALDLPC